MNQAPERAARASYRIIYGDTDQMGVVYYANYLRFFELGRCTLTDALGLKLEEIEQADYFLPVIDVQCSYKYPAKFNDVLDIKTWIAETGRVRVKICNQITTTRNGETVLVAEGHTIHVCMGRNGRPKRVPPFIAAAIAIPPA